MLLHESVTHKVAFTTNLKIMRLVKYRVSSGAVEDVYFFTFLMLLIVIDLKINNDVISFQID